MNPIYPSRTRRTHAVAEFQQEEAGANGTLGGRLSGSDLADGSGRIALDLTALSPGSVPADGLVEVSGTRTERGMQVSEIRLVAPRRAPAPPDTRIDLETLRARDRMLGAIRSWFREHEFLEVETPTLFRAPGLNPHIAEFRSEYVGPSGRVPVWLRTSPEVYHKRLLAAGVERMYELGRFFRNGERTALHNPEFTGLEFYEAWSDYRRIMELTESLIAEAFRAVTGSTAILASGTRIETAPPWERITVRESLVRYAGVDLAACPDLERLRAAARRIGIQVAGDDRFDDVFFRIFLERVEPRLGIEKPVFLHDYPLSMGVMAKESEADPTVAERVELYIGGVELANGFTELNDPGEQRRRFEEDRLAVASRDGVPPGEIPLDEGFLQALSFGMPPSSGIAIGLDRVLMLALGRSSLDEIIPFPFPAGE